jgi:uncharacterized protein YmfQ (DUF2313 family)
MADHVFRLLGPPPPGQRYATDAFGAIYQDEEGNVLTIPGDSAGHSVAVTGSTLFMQHEVGAGAIEPGWPCALLPASPPSVADRLTGPVASELLAQILMLTPRGPAWGTDEAGDGSGASAVWRRFWTALSGWAADLYTSAFAVAVQAFPSAATSFLPAWEREYGLPDPCVSGASGTAGRTAALRARFGAVGGSSPAYFGCLARSIGYDISIEEPTQFICDISECDGPHEVAELNVHDTWIVRFSGQAMTYFRPDDGVCDETPLEGFLIPADLECAFRRVAPAHTTLVFAYS